MSLDQHLDSIKTAGSHRQQDTVCYDLSSGGLVRYYFCSMESQQKASTAHKENWSIKKQSNQAPNNTDGPPNKRMLKEIKQSLRGALVVHDTYGLSTYYFGSRESCRRMKVPERDYLAAVLPGSLICLSTAWPT